MIHRVGIHSLVFRAIMARFFVSEKAKERFALEKEQIAHAGWQIAYFFRVSESANSQP